MTDRAKRVAAALQAAGWSIGYELDTAVCPSCDAGINKADKYCRCCGVKLHALICGTDIEQIEHALQVAGL